MPDTPNPSTTRAWLLATLDEAGSRLNMAAQAGVVDPVAKWTDPDGVAITAALHGAGLTLTACDANGQPLVGPLTVPRGWTTPPED